VRRYHLDLRKGEAFVLDAEGRDFPSLDAARAEAVRGARGIVAADVLEGRLDLDLQIIVADETGIALVVVKFTDAVEHAGSPAVGAQISSAPMPA